MAKIHRQLLQTCVPQEAAVFSELIKISKEMKTFSEKHEASNHPSHKRETHRLKMHPMFFPILDIILTN